MHQETTATAPSTSKATSDETRMRLDPSMLKAEQLKAGTYDSTAVCVYDGRPATAHRTGESGNRYGLCAECAETTVPMDGLPVVQHATEDASCHMYPGLCVRIDGEEGEAVDENGRHFDHGSYAYTVPSGEMPEDDPEIWAEFVHVSSGVPHISFMGEDLAPDQAHEKANQMRKFADELDELAYQVQVARGLFNLRQARETADPAFAEVLTIMEKAIVEDGADPGEVSDEVLRILRQARAEKRTEIPA
jgi:hypothetical protein